MQGGRKNGRERRAQISVGGKKMLDEDKLRGKSSNHKKVEEGKGELGWGESVKRKETPWERDQIKRRREET